MERVKLSEGNAGVSWGVSIGEQTTSLINRQTKLDQEEKDTVIDEAASILERCANPNGGTCSNTGLAIGYVQSGKTLSFTTLTALAKDNNYKMVIILAGIATNLLEQTSKRLRSDLLIDSANSREYKLFENPDILYDADTIANSLKLTRQSPLLIVIVLKHHLRIANLTEVLKNHSVRMSLENKGVLIIDDEADQASLNTLAKKNSRSPDWEEDEFSSTYVNLRRLREVINNHTYIQYTATPQAPLLINLLDLMSPDFHQILSPGKSYTGGLTFFQDQKNLLVKEIPDNEVYNHKKNQLPETPQSLVQALVEYFIRATMAVYIDRKANQVSMMIHAAREIDASTTFYNWIKNIVRRWLEILESPKPDDKQEILNLFHDIYNKLNICTNISFTELMDDVYELMLDTNIELIIKDNNFDDWGNSQSHIVIGADKLNRGFTVEGLIVTYMTRESAGRSNADTIQQRCRFFGYKKDLLPYCKVYLPANSVNEYEYYVEHEESLREALKSISLEEYAREMILDSSMNPTRNNILSRNLVRNKMNGWRQFNSVIHYQHNNQLFANFIETYRSHFVNIKEHIEYLSETMDRTHRIANINIDEVIILLSNYRVSSVSDSMRKSATLQYLNYWKSKGITSIRIVDMAFRKETGRERSVKFEGNSYKINNIWSGPSNKSKNDYPGDKSMRIKGEITIQIHRIVVKSESKEVNNKKITTLGIFYPSELELNFIG